MDVRREMFGAAVRLAIAVSTLAVLAIIGLERVGEFSPGAIVASVAVVGFGTSWVVTGRVARTASIPSAHRISVIPLRQRVG